MTLRTVRHPEVCVLEQAAKVFLLTADTISSWVRRIDEAGSEALVQTCQPVNKFPDCVATSSSGSRLSAPPWESRRSLKYFAEPGCIWEPPPSAGFNVGRQNTGRSYFRQRPANRSPRFEPRALWPRPAPSALPQVLVKGQPEVRIELEVSYQHSRKHLSIATIRARRERDLGESLIEQHAVSLRRSSHRLPSRLHPERGASTSRAPIHRIGMRSLLPGIANHPEFDRRISPDQRSMGRSGCACLVCSSSDHVYEWNPGNLISVPSRKGPILRDRLAIMPSRRAGTRPMVASIGPFGKNHRAQPVSFS